MAASTTFNRMPLTDRTTRALILLCLLCFQAQTMAGVWIPCQHAVYPGEAAFCAMHLDQTIPASDVIDGSDDGRLDCAKCALTAAIGVVHGLPVNSYTFALMLGELRQPPPTCFYDQVFPESPQHPPQSQTS